MSKSQAIEGVMKIFLMIAVIIVGMSFLLKAFGIDLLGWLQEMFESFPSEGYALHVKFDSDENEIFEFHLTNGENAPTSDQNTRFDTSVKYHLSEKGGPRLEPFGIIPVSVIQPSYFIVKPSSNGCLLFTTDEESIPADKGRVYEVKAGSIVQGGCYSLQQCIGENLISSYSNPIACKSEGGIGSVENVKNCGGNSCVKIEDGLSCTHSQKCSDYKNYLYTGAISVDPMPPFPTQTICGNIERNLIDKEGKVWKKQFNELSNWKDECEQHSKGTKNRFCDILTQNNLQFEIKYGILCDTDGKWHVCKPKVERIINDFFTATCSPDGDVFKWGVTYTLKETKIECVFPSINCIFNKGDKGSISDIESVNVCGQLLTIDDKPLSDRTLTLKIFDNLKPLPSDTPSSITIGKTGNDGIACMDWVPGKKFTGTTYKYQVQFSGETIYEKSQSLTMTLQIGFPVAGGGPG